MATKATNQLLEDLDSDDVKVRMAAAQNPNATPEALLKAMEDTDWHVRWYAADNPNATSQVLLKALEDEDRNIRWLTAGNERATSQVLLKAIEDADKYVRSRAVQNPKIKTLPLTDEKWFSLIAEGAFDNFVGNIPSRIKKDPRYKSTRLLKKISSQ
jgi:hypothetical protein